MSAVPALVSTDPGAQWYYSLSVECMASKWGAPETLQEITLPGSSRPLQQQIATDFQTQGNRQLLLEEYDAALELYFKAIAACQRADLYSDRATCYVVRKMWIYAVDDLLMSILQALNFGASRFDTLKQLAHCHQSLKEWRHYEGYLLQCLDQSPSGWETNKIICDLKDLYFWQRDVLHRDMDKVPVFPEIAAHLLSMLGHDHHKLAFCQEGGLQACIEFSKTDARLAFLVMLGAIQGNTHNQEELVNCGILPQISHSIGILVLQRMDLGLGFADDSSCGEMHFQPMSGQNSEGFAALT
eukprot:gene12324-2248_t